MQQVVRAAREVAVRLQRGGDEPQHRSEHHDEHEPCQRVEAAVDEAPARAGRQAQGGHRAASRSRRKVRYQTATHTSMTSMSSVEAAAPNPNRLFEKDWRTMRVIIRSASDPGFVPRITCGTANWYAE